MKPIIVGRLAEFHKDHPLATQIKNRMTIPNPEWEKAKALGYSTRGIDRFIKLYDEVGNYVRFPRAVVHGLAATYEIEDRTAKGERYEIRSLIQLRDYQKGFVDTLEQALRDPNRFGAVGQAAAGFGKTVCSLEVASRLGVKVLILVHKEFLMTQWIERILGTERAAQKLGISLSSFSEVMPPCLDLQPEDVGIVQQDRCEWRGKPIVVAMAQSLVAREYEPEFYESFGLILVDEVHRFAAPTFQSAIVQFPAAKRLGVTATPERQDGLEDVFFAHIGRIVAKGDVPRAKPRIYRVKTPVVVNSAIRNQLRRRGREDYVETITFLTQHEARNRFLVRQILKAAGHERKVLVLSHRREHLSRLREMLLDACREREVPLSIDFYVGGMDLKARKRAEKMQVILATYAMAKEGLDVPDLDTLFMATPAGDVHQAVGRILRLYDGKRSPVVVDPVDTGLQVARSLANKREREYKSLGWL